MIFETATTPPSRITPVVFRDELLQASLLRMRWKPGGLGGKVAPLAVDLPTILYDFCQFPRLDAVPHREVRIVLAVKNPGGYGNRAPGHDLRDENNSSSIIATVFAANVEAQVDLIEISVKWNGETSEKPGTAESKAHEAEVGSPLEGIERRTCGNMPVQQTGINLVVQHRQISPFGGKEYAFRVRRILSHAHMERL
jgi:hypothetical protein